MSTNPQYKKNDIEIQLYYAFSDYDNVVNLRKWIWIAMLGDRLVDYAAFPYIGNRWTDHYHNAMHMGGGR